MRAKYSTISLSHLSFRPGVPISVAVFTRNRHRFCVSFLCAHGEDFSPGTGRVVTDDCGFPDPRTGSWRAARAAIVVPLCARFSIAHAGVPVWASRGLWDCSLVFSIPAPSPRLGSRSACDVGSESSRGGAFSGRALRAPVRHWVRPGRQGPPGGACSTGGACQGPEVGPGPRALPSPCRPPPPPRTWLQRCALASQVQFNLHFPKPSGSPGDAQAGATGSAACSADKEK